MVFLHVFIFGQSDLSVQYMGSGPRDTNGRPIKFHCGKCYNYHMKNKKYVQVAALIIGIVVLGLIAWAVVKWPAGPTQPTTGPQQQSASTTVAATSSSVSTPTRSPAAHVSLPASPSTPSPAAPKAAAIAITSPASNAQWIFESQHTIQWSRAAGAPNGTISLLNASTRAVVGWIQQQIVPQQTSFPWNTRDLFVGLVSPLKEDVLPGNYRIGLTFDSPSILPVVGPVFSIIAPSEAQVPTSTVIIQGASFSPSSIAVE